LYFFLPRTLSATTSTVELADSVLVSNGLLSGIVPHFAFTLPTPPKSTAPPSASPSPAPNRPPSAISQAASPQLAPVNFSATASPHSSDSQRRRESNASRSSASSAIEDIASSSGGACLQCGACLLGRTCPITGIQSEPRVTAPPQSPVRTPAPRTAAAAAAIGIDFVTHTATFGGPERKPLPAHCPLCSFKRATGPETDGSTGGNGESGGSTPHSCSDEASPTHPTAPDHTADDTPDDERVCQACELASSCPYRNWMALQRATLRSDKATTSTAVGDSSSTVAVPPTASPAASPIAPPAAAAPVAQCHTCFVSPALPIVRTLIHLVDGRPPGTTWSIGCPNEAALPLAAAALTLGGHLRLGTDTEMDRPLPSPSGAPPPPPVPASSAGSEDEGSAAAAIHKSRSPPNAEWCCAACSCRSGCACGCSAETGCRCLDRHHASAAPASSEPRRSPSAVLADLVAKAAALVAQVERKVGEMPVPGRQHLQARMLNRHRLVGGLSVTRVRRRGARGQQVATPNDARRILGLDPANKDRIMKNVTALLTNGGWPQISLSPVFNAVLFLRAGSASAGEPLPRDRWTRRYEPSCRV